MNGDARDMSMIPDNIFDIALLISVIEHIPSNTIYCEKRQAWKSGEMLKAENPEKQRVISEMNRVVKPGGVSLITTDMYLDYPQDMNLSWVDLLGLPGVERDDLTTTDDLFIVDDPLHKGRVAPVGIVIEKMLAGRP